MVVPRKPLLLLNVDGVLAPFGSAAKPAGFTEHVLQTELLGDHRVWLNLDHGAMLQPLQDHFEFIWCTGWEDEAPLALGPLFGLRSAPVIHLTYGTTIELPLNKLPNILDFTEGKAVAWIDDDLGHREREWADARAEATLLLTPDPTIGLQPSHIDALMSFAASVVPEASTATTEI